ncbi:MAG: hypothetical protein IPN68_15910 [Bacteroidetes bacterium]|nr:hypothetical protein [Bacteroidota bacterium]
MTMASADGEMFRAQQLKEVEAYYTSQINALYLEAQPMLTANPDLHRRSEFRVLPRSTAFMPI